MHLKFPYFTYLHLSRTITRKLLLVKFFPRTRNSYLLRKAIKKNIPRFVEFSSLQTSSMQSNKIGKKKSDTDSFRRIVRKNHATGIHYSFRFVIILETRACMRGLLRAERLGRPRGQFPGL